MASNSTLALASDYLRRHMVSEAEFGMAHAIETDDWRLFGYPFVPQRRIQLVLAHTGGYNDCESIAGRICQDVSARNPELRPMIGMGRKDGTGMHNWVQVQDPKSGDIVQIDGTPWYARLDPGHKGVETEYRPVPWIVPLTMVPFSVRRTADGMFINVSMGGSVPRCKGQKERGVAGRLATAYDGRPMLVPENEPVYSFLFQVTKDRGFWTESDKPVHVLIQVMDLVKLHILLASGASMDDLAADRALDIGLAHCFNTKNAAFIRSRMANMREAAGKAGRADLFAEFERSVPTILKLLSGADSPLPIVGRPDQELNVTNGRIDAGDGRRYREFVGMLERKNQGQDYRKRAMTR